MKKWRTNLLGFTEFSPPMIFLSSNHNFLVHSYLEVEQNTMVISQYLKRKYFTLKS